MKRRRILPLIVILAAISVVAVAAVLLQPIITPDDQSNDIPSNKSDSADAPALPAPYSGQIVRVGDRFNIKVPGGWRASISTQTGFLAVLFARPSQLESLVYDQAIAPSIDYGGIPSWSGLTEHFYVRAITAPSQAFNPSRHAEVTSESFVFDDGVVGTKYIVTKHASEAAAWGGLQKDSYWNGYTYLYNNGAVNVEAHLALYPSTQVDKALYEAVVRSIQAD